MGRSKLHLPFRGITLIEFVAAEVDAAAGSVVLVGHEGISGFPGIPDLYPGFGPTGGIVTALAHTTAEWNLIVACDMPGVDRTRLAELLAEAERTQFDALAPVSTDGQIHPLCAVYRKRALEGLRQAVDAGIHTVKEALRLIRVKEYPVAGDAWLANINTPEDWASVSGRQE